MEIRKSHNPLLWDTVRIQNQYTINKNIKYAEQDYNEADM